MVQILPEKGNEPKHSPLMSHPASRHRRLRLEILSLLRPSTWGMGCTGLFGESVWIDPDRDPYIAPPKKLK
jgi:hypothetical protein